MFVGKTQNYDPTMKYANEAEPFAIYMYICVCVCKCMLVVYMRTHIFLHMPQRVFIHTCKCINIEVNNMYD